MRTLFVLKTIHIWSLTVLSSLSLSDNFVQKLKTHALVSSNSSSLRYHGFDYQSLDLCSGLTWNAFVQHLFREGQIIFGMASPPNKGNVASMEMPGGFCRSKHAKSW